MSCPECKVELSFLEFAWTHRHEPPFVQKVIGFAMMCVGVVLIAIALRELL